MKAFIVKTTISFEKIIWRNSVNKSRTSRTKYRVSQYCYKVRYLDICRKAESIIK